MRPRLWGLRVWRCHNGENTVKGILRHLKSAIVDRGTVSANPTILECLQTSGEEMFEMLDLTAFVHALSAYIRSYQDISVRVRADESGRSMKSRGSGISSAAEPTWGRSSDGIAAAKVTPAAVGTERHERRDGE